MHLRIHNTVVACKVGNWQARKEVREVGDGLGVDVGGEVESEESREETHRGSKIIKWTMKNRQSVCGYLNNIQIGLSWVVSEKCLLDDVPKEMYLSLRVGPRSISSYPLGSRNLRPSWIGNLHDAEVAAGRSQNNKFCRLGAEPANLIAEQNASFVI